MFPNPFKRFDELMNTVYTCLEDIEQLKREWSGQPANPLPLSATQVQPANPWAATPPLVHPVPQPTFRSVQRDVFRQARDSEIVKRRKEGETLQQLAMVFGLSISSVQRICAK